jgi:2-dehydro-3-deoxy-D-arabinonate dehydratase
MVVGSRTQETGRIPVHLVRFARPHDPTPRPGLVDDGGALHAVDAPGIGALLGESLGEIRTRLEAAAGTPAVDGEVIFLPPVDGRMEVWAAGVTYHRSRDARMEESATADVYQLVYDAERPELFMKSVPWRVVTDSESVSIRRDSGLDVPEPELAVMANSAGEIVAYGVCDDVSSRRIEGDNPLYLPQAKIYAGACALSAGFRPAWEIADPANLAITVHIHRGDALAWEGETSTASIKRAPAELVEYLQREEQFPEGAVLSTGTGIVPEMTFTLEVGDVIAISIAEVGVLANPVVAGRDHLAWLVDALADPSKRNPEHGGPLAAFRV